MLAHLATLAPAGSVAERVNFASAVFAAVAAALVSLAVLEAIATIGEVSGQAEASRTGVSGAEVRRRKREARARTVKATVAPLLAPTWPNTLLPAITAGLLPCSRTVWSYATIAEVYTLNTMLLALAVLSMFRWRRLILNDRATIPRAGGRVEGSDHDRWVNVAALLFGLGLGVHHVTVGLVLPAFAALVLATEGWRFFGSKWLAVAAVFAFAGLSVYIYLPVVASRLPLLNWGDPRTLERFLSHVTGWQYQPFFGAKPWRVAHQVAEWFSLTLREFGPVWLPLTLMLAMTGGVYLWRRSRGLLWFLVTAAAANLAYNFNYEIAEDKDAYYLPVFLVISLAAGLGTRYATELVSDGRVGALNVGAIVSAALLLTVPAVALASNFRFNNRRHYFIARDYGENILSTVAHR